MGFHPLLQGSSWPRDWSCVSCIRGRFLTHGPTGDTWYVASSSYSRRRQWHPTPVFLPGKSHGRRSLVGYSPWGRWGSDMTERLHFHFPALEKAMATHSSVLAWRIPGTVEPGGLPSMGSHRVGHDWSDLAAEAASYSIWWMSGHRVNTSQFVFWDSVSTYTRFLHLTFPHIKVLTLTIYHESRNISPSYMCVCMYGYT